MASVSINTSSRYVETGVYSAVGGKPYLGLWEAPVIEARTDDSYYRVKQSDVGRLDLLAYTMYSDPSLWWVIAHRNNIEDPLLDMVVGEDIVIPSSENVFSVLAKTR